ncbi:MAG: Rpn family recombination-promoting nuclease/putative transposase [Salinispira sp.]
MVHDKSWKYVFENPRIFRDFIHSYFNTDLARSIVPGSMLSINPEFIHKGELRHSVSDIIYKTACHFKDSMKKPLDVYFIIEFQSTVDSAMDRRLLLYAHHLSKRITRSQNAKNDYRIITLVIYTCSGAPMLGADPRTLDFQTPPSAGFQISPYLQINIDTFSNDELISVGGVLSAIMYIENIGSIKDYSKETIAILKDMIQNESAENKEVLYEWISIRFYGTITKDETKKLFAGRRLAPPARHAAGWYILRRQKLCW